MKKFAALLFVLTSCNAQDAKTAETDVGDVLSVGQIACVALTTITSVPDIKKICNIVSTSAQIDQTITQLAQEREAAGGALAMRRLYSLPDASSTTDAPSK